MKSALAIAEDFAVGSMTPVDALHNTQAQLAIADPQLHIMLTKRDAELAEEDAQASSDRWREGRPLSALDGIPIAVKDNILTRDMPTSWGNAYLADQPGTVDEIAVDRLRRAGMVIIGKTSVPEFTLEGFTANALVGVTGNPWQPALTPGGSSGGSVAGVAAGCFPLALGTDGGGSIRRPAGYTSLVGLKPTIGRIPRNHTLPALLLDYEVIGPIGRSVADVAALFKIVAGPDPTDRSSLALPVTSAGQGLPDAPRVLLVSRLGDHPVDPLIDDSMQSVLMQCKLLGWQIECGPLPVSIDPINSVWSDIGQIGLAELARSMPAAIEAAAEKYQSWATDAAGLPVNRLLTILETTRVLRRDVDAIFEQFDLVMMPTASAMPWPADQTHPNTIAGQAAAPRTHAVFTGWINAAGLPAIALPGAPAPNKLPIGFQLIGPWGADLTLLAAAQQLEDSLHWTDRWPAGLQAN